MIYCAKCGQSQQPDAKRCPNCGSKIKASKKERKRAVEELVAAQSGMRLVEPKASTANALGYEMMYENGTCRVKTGRYSRTVEFLDANFQAARRDEQEQIYEQYSELLNSYDSSVDPQVTILCQAVDADVWRQEMYMREVEGDEVGNRYRRELNNIIDMRVAESGQHVRRRRFITFTVDAETKEKADVALGRACETGIRQLKNMGAEAWELSGVERLRVIDSITNPEDNPDMISYQALQDQPGLTTRDLVAPPDFTRDKIHGAKSCSWGKCHGELLYLEKYATTTRSDFIADLAELPYNSIITLSMAAWDQSEAKQTVESYLTDTKVQKTDYVLKHSQQMYISNEMLPSNLQDALANAENLRDDLANGDQKYWRFGMTILTWSDSAEKTAQQRDELQTIVRGYNMRLEPMTGLQLEGFQTSLATGYDGMPEGWHYNMCTAPMAAFIPLTSIEIQDPGGMWYGHNTVSKNFIFYDRKNATSPNGFILGKPGRGKSVQAKMTIINQLLQDPTAEVIVLDPEHEYVAVADAMDGQVIQISGNTKTYINPLDIALDSKDAGGGLANKVDAILSMVDEMCKGLTTEQESLIDRTCSQIYEKYFETRDEADIPTLVEFAETLRSQPEPEGARLATTIERYVSGQANVFAHRTNVDTHSRFLVYDIRDLPENMKGLGLLILLDATWKRIVENRDKGIRTWLFVDELQLLLDNAYALEYFDHLWTRSRKYGAIPTGITQNVERLLNNERTRLMVANSDFMIVLGQSASDAAGLGQIMNLSSQQVATIRNAGVGEGLIVAEGRIVPFRNILPKDTNWYRVTTTKIDDLNEMRVEEEDFEQDDGPEEAAFDAAVWKETEADGETVDEIRVEMAGESEPASDAAKLSEEAPDEDETLVESVMEMDVRDEDEDKDVGESPASDVEPKFEVENDASEPEPVAEENEANIDRIESEEADADESDGGACASKPEKQEEAPVMLTEAVESVTSQEPISEQTKEPAQEKVKNRPAKRKRPRLSEVLAKRKAAQND
jgi:hypothetical protein